MHSPMETFEIEVVQSMRSKQGILIMMQCHIGNRRSQERVQLTMQIRVRQKI